MTDPRIDVSAEDSKSFMLPPRKLLAVFFSVSIIHVIVFALPLFSLTFHRLCCTTSLQPVFLVADQTPGTPSKLPGFEDGLDSQLDLIDGAVVGMSNGWTD
ncbi:hypothetical protein EVAR_51460_1 [Eumeta japonica]|uniref:Uncharacterized protein n=1 Tax=Eumeta variegata TaxID=151549 RepID=A0A4C1XTV2_EUMVA|nr:hypothetical protein EVAR_51460_1 [Eumeta japonica]